MPTVHSSNPNTTPINPETPKPIQQALQEAGLVKDGDVIQADDSSTTVTKSAASTLPSTITTKPMISRIDQLRQQRQAQAAQLAARMGHGTTATQRDWSKPRQAQQTQTIVKIEDQPVDPLDIVGPSGYTPRMEAWMADPGFTMLLDILGTQRPMGSQSEWDIIKRYVYPISGVTEDRIGNLVIDIGEPNGVLWSCHTDTVHSKYETRKQKLTMSQRGILQLSSKETATCLGADDGTGMWIMLEMIKGNVPGRYVFHFGEESGCIGSKSIKNTRPEVLEGIRFAIAFDRAGTSDVITHQRSSRCCSDAFALSLAAQLPGNYAPARGVYTDTAEYTGTVPECTNISVGYQGQHGSGETQNVPHLLRLRDAMLKIDPSQFVVERDPKAKEVSTFRTYGRGYTPFGQAGSQSGPTSSYAGSEEFWDDYEERQLAGEIGYTQAEIEALFPKPTAYDKKGNPIKVDDDLDADDVYAATGGTKNSNRRVGKGSEDSSSATLRRLAEEQFRASLPPTPHDIHALVKMYPEEVASILDDMGMSVPMFWDNILKTLGFQKQ